jgi:hypothetical protein
MARPAHVLVWVVLAYWHGSNGPLEGSGVVNSEEVMRVWWCRCRKHTHRCTTKTLTTYYPTGYPCHICAKAFQSLLEGKVWWELLRRGVFFEVFVKVLKGHFGSADLYIPHLDLIIAVDGPHHMEEAIYTTPLAQQQRIDSEFNDECVRQRRRLLRLHYKDINLGLTWEWVSIAIVLCGYLPPTHTFILFSPHYTKIGYNNVFAPGM